MYNEIRQQLEKVILHSQGVDADINCGQIIDMWEMNKRRFWTRTPWFDCDRLIYESKEEVSFKVSQKQKEHMLGQFIHNSVLEGYDDLAEFVSTMEECFWTNRTDRNYHFGDKVIPKGMKIVKAFKFFVNNRDDLKLYRDTASAILNWNEIKGTLCLSIHPLDYMSISENNCDWRSCHALNSDYRAGNLCYIQDSATVVAYIRQKNKNQHIPRFPEDVPWNSKIWRVLLFFNEALNFVMAGKEYPCECPEAMDALIKLMSTVERDPNSWEKRKHFGYFKCWETFQLRSIELPSGDTYTFKEYLIPIGKTMKSVRDLYQVSGYSLQYNDILRNPKYNTEVKYTYYLEKPTPMNPYKHYTFGEKGLSPTIITEDCLLEIHVGSEVTCPFCHNKALTITNSMMCDKCLLENSDPDDLDEDTFPTCCICGDRFLYYEGRYDDETGGMICDCCLEVMGKPTSKDDEECCF